MVNAFFTALKVRDDERGPVSLLLAMGFFTGVFLASYQVGAETIFLSKLKDQLEEAFLAAGILGVISTSLFSYAQSRVKFSKLVTANYFFISLYTLAIFISFNYLDEKYQDFIAFFMFAMIGPVTAINLLSFWGIFGRLFNLRQSKRIIGWIDSGQLLAAIIAFFFIPLMWGWIGDTDNIFLLSTISIVFAAIILIFLVNNYELKYGERLTKELSSEQQSSLKWKNLFKGRYVRILSMFLLFSMMTFVIVQYSFQDAISKQYTTDESLRNFISFFRGFVLVFMFFLQTFVNDRILSEYGIKVALLILPVVLAVFIVLAIISGTVFGYDVEGGLFIYFLISVSISHLFGYSLRDALENPTFKLYFMPLDDSVRFNIQTKIEGIVNEASRLVGGIFIFTLSSLSFIKPIHYPILVVVLLIGYFYIIGRMYTEYRNKVREKLESADSSEYVEKDEDLVVKKLLGKINLFKPKKAIFSFRLIEKIKPGKVSENVNLLMKHEDEIVQDYAQERINEINGLSVSEDYIVTYKENFNEGRKVLTRADLFALFERGDFTQQRIIRLIKSSDFSDRLYAAELILNSSKEENTSLLMELLLDDDFNVRTSALKVAQKKFDNEIINAVISNLSSPVLTNLAADTLVVIGAKALNNLEAAFFKSGQSTAVMIKIVQVMGSIGGNKSKSMLWSKLNYPDKIIVSQVLLALGRSNFKAGISQITQIKYAIESDIEDIAWNIKAITEVHQEGFGKEIIRALEEENEHDIDHIYMLLGMLYDPNSIQLVKENIEMGTTETISFALELLDVFLSDDLKQKIIPLVDDISPSEKAKKLEVFFPREKLNDKIVLKFLMNRDFNQSNRYTKACVIYQIGLLKHRDYTLDIVANLFNPDTMIMEISAWTLYEFNPELYEEHVGRLPEAKQIHLDFMIKKEKVYRVKFFVALFFKKMQIFEGFHGLVISELVDLFTIIELAKDDYIPIDTANNDYFYIVYKGKVMAKENEFDFYEYEAGSFINEITLKSDDINDCFITAVKNTVLLKIYKDQFYDFLADHTTLALNVVENV